MSFDPAPVRLRRKAVKQLKQSSAQQLEIETKKMEERIRALKEQMMREKEERERSGGIKWNSSKPGAFVNARNQPGTKKKSPKGEKGPRKIKILTDEPLSSYVRKSIATVESPNDPAPTGGGAVCGQCERTRTLLICVECGENYCAECFKTFHQKGALKRHTTKSLYQDQNGTITPRPQGGLLLKGSYNEEESSASFAEAVREWRNSNVVKNSNTWVNPAHNETSTGTSMGDDTATVAAKLKEIKIEFKENNALSYMDRLLLKKHRKNTLQSVAKPNRPVSVGVSSRTNIKPRYPDCNHINERDESKDELGLNYREIVQSVCTHVGKLNQESRSGRSCSDGELVGMKDSCCRVTIEEVLSGCDAIEETAVCMVEEATIGNSPISVARPPSQSGRISIMTLTSTGDFRDDVEALTLEDVSSLSSGSPVSESRSSIRHSADTLRTTSSHAASKMRVGSNGGRTIQNKKTARHASLGVLRVWSPQLSYTGLSSFFLNGVKPSVQSSETVKREGPDSAIGPRAHVSRELLNKAVWKPEDSVIISVTDVEDTIQDDSSSETVCQSLPTSVVQIPESIRNTTVSEVFPIICEPEPNSGNNMRGLKSDQSHQNDSGDATSKIHDFGIVDFLQAGPTPSKGKTDFDLVHRVSTVSPLALSPNPPKLYWSDDDSDDDFIEEVVSLVQNKEGLLHDKQDQDFDDSATLNDLAWELESTTGKPTLAAIEADSLSTTLNVQEKGRGQFSQDSIEGDEGGTELDFPDEIDCEFDSLDEEDEDRASRMEVAALD